MKRFLILSITISVLLVFAFTGSSPAQVGFSVSGGVGAGYYSMDELNNHIGKVTQEIGTGLKQISNGINASLRVRLWLFDRYAFAAGYERCWAETEIPTEGIAISYKAPANFYSIGGALNVLALPNLLDFNLGASMIFARPIYGTNYQEGRRLREFKGSDRGLEIFAEAVTNFVRPVEVGFQLGYRNLKVKTLEDKFGLEPPDYYDILPVDFRLDYSGAFFYLTAGIRL